jgi:oligopeptidase A
MKKTRLLLPNFKLSPAEQLEEAVRCVLAADEQIETALNNETYTWDNLVVPLLLADNEITKANSIVSFYYAIVSGEESSTALKQFTIFSAARTSKIIEDGRMFAALSSLKKSKLTKKQKAIVEHQLLYFTQSGASISQEKKAELEKVSKQLTEQTIAFQLNYKICEEAWQLHVTDESMLDGVDESTKKMLHTAAKEQGLDGWLIRYAENTIDELIRDCTNRTMRQKLFFATQTMASDYSTREEDNFNLITDILHSRHKKAKLLGHKNFASLALEGMSVTDPVQIIRILERMISKTNKKLKREYRELSKLAKGEISKLERWDLDHYSQRWREEFLEQKPMSDYLETIPTFRRMLEYFGTLLDIKFVEASPPSKPHKSVMFFEAYKDDKLLGGFYADILRRPGKHDGAWVNNYSFRVFDEPQVLVYALNYEKTMGHSDLIVMLHEFGHLLHGLYNTSPYSTYGGSLSLSWDAIEFPSQFFENFAWHPASLKVLARHYETGRPPTAKMIATQIESRYAGSGCYMQRYIKKALADITLHYSYKDKPDFVDDTTVPIFHVDGIRYHQWENRILSRMHHSFSFDSGYESMYYVYFWSEMIARDAFEPFIELKTSFDMGTELKKFMTAFIEPVDEDIRKLFKKYMGRSFNTRAWAKFYGFDK